MMRAIALVNAPSDFAFNSDRNIPRTKSRSRKHTKAASQDFDVDVGILGKGLNFHQVSIIDTMVDGPGSVARQSKN
jgi:hypothetical protein